MAQKFRKVYDIDAKWFAVYFKWLIIANNMINRRFRLFLRGDRAMRISLHEVKVCGYRFKFKKRVVY
jgi:hypothetical protein